MRNALNVNSIKNQMYCFVYIQTCYVFKIWILKYESKTIIILRNHLVHILFVDQIVQILSKSLNQKTCLNICIFYMIERVCFV